MPGSPLARTGEWACERLDVVAPDVPVSKDCAMPPPEPDGTATIVKWVVRIALVGVAFLVISSLVRLLLIALVHPGALRRR